MLTTLASAAIADLWARTLRGLAAWGEEQARWFETNGDDRPLDEQELTMRVLMSHWF